MIKHTCSLALPCLIALVACSDQSLAMSTEVEVEEIRRESPVPTEPSSTLEFEEPIILPTQTLVDRSGWIAFSSIRNGDQDLYLVNPDNSDLAKMGLSELRPSQPAWSPDGQMLAFDGGGGDIYIVNSQCVDFPEGCLSSAVNLTRNRDGIFLYPSWTPDGEEVTHTYGEANTFFTLAIESSSVTGDQVRELFSSVATLRAPDWSPDGNSLAFTSDQYRTDALSMGDVAITESDGSIQIQLIEAHDNIRDSYEPAWSPDGTQIAFVTSAGDEFVGTFVESVYVFALENREVGLLVENGSHPSWSPDGSQIVFQAIEGLFVIDVDGSGLRQLTDVGIDVDFAPAWSP